MEAITAFLESFDIAKLLPELGSLISDLRFWVSLFMLVGPIVMLALGWWYFFLPTKEANHHIGFRTHFGMGSVEAWRYAQRRAGLFYLIGGGVMTVASIILVIMSRSAEPMAMATTAFFVLAGQALIALILWIVLQVLVIKNFDQDGNRR